jgi:hypothetical protein
MSRPTQRWSSNHRQGSDDDNDYAGSSSREGRTRQPRKPQHQSQPQQRNVPVTPSWQGTEPQQRWWHRGAVSTVRQSSARLLQQQQPLRSAEVSSASASGLPWRSRNEFEEQQQKSYRSSWPTRERDDRWSQSVQEPFAQQRPAWPTRARPDTHDRMMATGRATQERMQIQRRPRGWDDARFSPQPTRHIDEQHPNGKLLSRRTNAVEQSRPWHQAEARDSSESEESDFQRDCPHERRSVAEFVRERVPAENSFRRATFSGRGTSTSSTRLTLPDRRVAARPCATKFNTRHQAENDERFVWSPGSRNGVVVDAAPTQTTQRYDFDPSSDYEDGDDLGDDGDRVARDQMDDSDSLTRRQLVLGKRKAVDGASRNDLDRRGLIGVATSAKPKVKQNGKVCKVGDCTKLVRSRGVCVAHGGGKRCQYPDGCGKSSEGATPFCIAHGGGKRCRYPDGCDKSALGATPFCAAHGGGKRCQYPDGCDKIALGTTSFCRAHGGGKRCQYPEGCDKGAEGRALFCITHGGGKRCQYPDGCDKSAIGRTTFCRAHGGGTRCQYPDGCGKGAEGPTLFCMAHGGGKRCQYPEGCDKGARGATLFCIAHGGGKRCIHSAGCNKHVVKRGMCKKHGVASGLWA